MPKMPMIPESDEVLTEQITRAGRSDPILLWLTYALADVINDPTDPDGEDEALRLTVVLNTIRTMTYLRLTEILPRTYGGHSFAVMDRLYAIHPNWDQYQSWVQHVQETADLTDLVRTVVDPKHKAAWPPNKGATHGRRNSRTRRGPRTPHPGQPGVD